MGAVGVFDFVSIRLEVTPGERGVISDSESLLLSPEQFDSSSLELSDNEDSLLLPWLLLLIILRISLR